jgi:8-oxo-(d)GTP phosphatase
MTSDEVAVRAAGGLLRRDGDGSVEFAVVHRHRYDDWTIPKGKLEQGESHREAALRELKEETGFICSMGRELPSTTYRDGQGRTKEVRYWLMSATLGAFQPNDEVDELRWLGPAESLALLSYERDRAVVEYAMGLDAPIFLVRHAKAGSRSGWQEDDRLRPLSGIGRKQAEAIARLLGDEDISRVASSPYIRCVQTVRPLAIAAGVPVEGRPEFAEGEDPALAWEWTSALTEPTAICSHGDVIPAMVEAAEREGARLPGTRECRKGSIWCLERRAGVVVSARYMPPE